MAGAPAGMAAPRAAPGRAGQRRGHARAVLRLRHPAQRARAQPRAPRLRVRRCCGVLARDRQRRRCSPTSASRRAPASGQRDRRAAARPLLPGTPAHQRPGRAVRPALPRGRGRRLAERDRRQHAGHAWRTSCERRRHRPAHDWRGPFFDAVTFLASAVRAAGFSAAAAQAHEPRAAGRRSPFTSWRASPSSCASTACRRVPGHAALLRQDAQYLRAAAGQPAAAAPTASHEHLEEHGVSVDVVFEVDQLRERAHRIDLLLDCVRRPRRARTRSCA